MPAAHLRIRVSVRGRVMADLTFPAAAVENLGGMVPDDVAVKLREDGLDPQAIGEKAAADGYPAGELFSRDDGAGKAVRVWLE